MEPRIQHVRTSDGVPIAWWALGDGPVLVSSGLPQSHVGLEWQTPAWRVIYEQAAQIWRFVRFDHRGCGLSGRDVDDFSLDALVRDLEAVVDRLQVPQIRMTASGLAGTVALAYCARHPDRMSHLVLVDVPPSDTEVPPMLAKIRDLAEADWEFAAQALIRFFFGWNDEITAREAAANFARSIRPRQLVAMTQASTTWDVEELLPRVTARVLLLNHVEHPIYDADSVQRQAARIPNAQQVLISGRMGPFLDAGTVQVMGQFLLDVPPEASPPPPAPQRVRTAVVLFADIADSTARTEQLGDDAFHRLAGRLHAELRDVVRGHRGRPMEGKLLGDGVVAVFESARDAIAAALACAARGEAGDLPLHLGVHAGDVLEGDGDVHGGAVNAAARIAALAPPGEVLVSDVVRGLARTSTSAVFEDRGAQVLRGIAEAQQLFRVRSR